MQGKKGLSKKVRCCPVAGRHCREHRTSGRAQLPALDGTALRVCPYLLCRKVFRKLHLCISDNDIQRVVSNRPGVIESILCALREKMEARTVHVGSAGTAVSVCTSSQPASLLCLLPFARSQSVCVKIKKRNECPCGPERNEVHT